MRLLGSIGLVVLLTSACSAAGSGSQNPSGGTGGNGGDLFPDAGNDSSISLDGGGSDTAPPAVGHLHGKVLAPEGTIPISGALVYLSSKTPDPIPDGDYCDKCVQLPSSVPYAYSNPDGTFDLPAYGTGDTTLVVQKGQFRRFRPFTVVAGDQNVDPALTTFPHKTDKANGDDIPKMAIVNAAWDNIDFSLAHLGVQASFMPGPFGIGQAVDRSTAAFDYYDGMGGAKGSYQAILSDLNVLKQYHIVFLPCSWSDSTTCYTSGPFGDPNVQANLRSFVESGGKLYVTDYSYEFVRQSFPGYVTWSGQTSTLGSACNQGAWDSSATSPDQGMTDWLNAQGVSSPFDITQSWTQIDHVSPGNTTDVDGNPITVTPKVWVQASSPNSPATVSFEQACGRVLFSTYHTEGTGADLAPQVRALLYVLLEVGVCVKPPSIQ